MTDPSTEKFDFDGLLACVECGKNDLTCVDDAYVCGGCGARAEVRDGVPIFLRDSVNVYADDPNRALFWDDGWDKRNAASLSQDRDHVEAIRADFVDMLQKQRYPLVTELSEENTAGRTLLNIGCGGGQEGLLFTGYGANYIGVDFSYNAARFTRILTGKLGYQSVCYQSEAEKLPIKDNCIDIVYTNGVLHHTPNTEDALREVFRVLAPGSTALIGLYATHSLAFYWYHLRAILAGKFSRAAIAEWIDANTEGEWQTDGRVNLYTRAYTRKSFGKILAAAGFTNFRMVQSQIQIKDLPVISRLTRILLPTSISDACVGPFGMMLVAICKK